MTDLMMSWRCRVRTYDYEAAAQWLLQKAPKAGWAWADDTFYLDDEEVATELKLRFG